MQIDNTTETHESWTPLKKALGHAQCLDFLWMGSSGTVQLYRHIDTRRHLYIDAITGQFYDDEDRLLLSKESAINYVLS